MKEFLDKAYFIEMNPYKVSHKYAKFIVSSDTALITKAKKQLARPFFDKIFFLQKHIYFPKIYHQRLLVAEL
jgi:hypothetical protein